MEDLSALGELAILIGAGVIAAYIAVRLKLPTIVGYLVAGIVLSLILPTTLEASFTQDIAQFGAALLLFTIGVEFSLETIRKVRNLVVIGSIAQSLIVLTTAFLVLPFLGFDDYQIFFIGILASTSSTAFVVKMLELRDETHTKPGTIMMGWLVSQDILIILWFLLLETFAPNTESAPDLGLAIIRAGIVIVTTFLAGQYILPPLLKKVAKTKSEELLTVSVVGTIAAFAVFANFLGVSFTVGAFLAGLALSESFLNHEIFTEVKPLRNLFMMVFFVSIGTLFDINSVTQNLGNLLVILFVIIGIKGFSIMAINVWFGVHIKNAIRVGLGIAQIGEFAFLGAQLGLASGWIDSDLYSLLIASTLVSMSLTPLLYANADWVYKLFEKNSRKISPTLHRSLFVNAVPEEEKTTHMSSHIILCGYGRVGQYVAAALQKSEVEFVVLEMDANKIEKAKKNGISILYGDATSQDILEKAGVKEAKVLVVSLPGKSETDLVIRHAKQVNKSIKVVARASRDHQGIDTKHIDHVIEPEFEIAVSIISKLYKLIRRRNKRALETVEHMKHETWEIKVSV